MALTGATPTGGPGPLARATELARGDAGAAPAETARRVLASAARLTGRPGRPGRPVLADIPGGAVWVSDTVLRSAVGRAVVAVPDVSPAWVRFRFDGDRVVGVAVGVAVTFGAAIAPAASAVRAAVRHQVVELLGMPLVPAVEVEVVDVLERGAVPGPLPAAIRGARRDEPR